MTPSQENLIEEAKRVMSLPDHHSVQWITEAEAVLQSILRAESQRVDTSLAQISPTIATHTYVAEPFAQIADDHRCVECGEQPDHPNHNAAPDVPSEWVPPCSECGIVPPGHKINCKTGNAKATAYQKSLRAPQPVEPAASELEDIRVNLAQAEADVRELMQTKELFRAERDAALAHVARLEGAFNKYATHKDDCEFITVAMGARILDCTCGLDTALQP